ncbi:MAG: TolC family protein [Acidobacteriota bacterium]|nr:TolC family protein [Acidobacteriota bacterium]
MRRHLYTFILSAGLLAAGSAAEVSAQTNEKTQVASVKTDFDKEVEKTETVEQPTENKTVKFVPRLFNSLKRVGVEPGQTAPFTLNEAIRRTLENNNDIEVARNDVRLNEQSLRAFEGFYDPFIGVTPTFTRSATTGQSARNDFTVNTDFSKNIKVGGGFIRTFYNNQRTENRFQQAQVSGSTIDGTGTSALFSSSLGFSFTQPLWRDRAIDNNRRNIKIQRKRLEQSDADFRQRTIEVIAQVQRAYWDLVFALRDQQNRVANLNLTKENLRRVEAQIAAGAAAPLARAEVATELANRESDLLLAAQNVTTAENTLKQLMLRDPNAPEWSTQLVPTDEPSFDQTPVKLDDALAEAKQNRPELRRLNLQREINDIDIKFFKNQTKPIVDLTGTVYLNGISQSIGQTNGNLEVDRYSGNDEVLRRAINQLAGTQLVPQERFLVPTTPGYLVGGFGQSNANLFRRDAPTYQVGVTIQIPVGNRTAEANLASAQIQQTRLDAQTRDTEQVVIAEVRNSVQAVETARQRVLTARIARENAEIQLQGEQKLYEVGRSTTFLLFQRENALANARNAEIRAETDFNKALADLQRATSTTLRTNNIIIESVVAP